MKQLPAILFFSFWCIALIATMNSMYKRVIILEPPAIPILTPEERKILCQ